MLIHYKNSMYFNLLFSNLNTIFFKRGKAVCIFLFNDTYFFKISFFKNLIYKFFYNSTINGVCFENKTTFIRIYKDFFNKYFRSINMLQYRFLEFKGRGFRYKFNKNNLLILAGYSHFIYFKLDGVYTFPLSKICISFYSYLPFFKYIRPVLYSRFLNIFTFKGLRTRDGFFLKKLGKISSYM